MSYAELPEPWVTSVTTFLGAQGFGTVGTNLFGFRMPQTPVTCLVVVPTGGGRRVGDPLVRRTFQVQYRVPETSGTAGATAIGSLAVLLRDCWNRLDAEHLGRIELQSEPGPYAVDEKGNFVYFLSCAFVGR